MIILNDDKLKKKKLKNYYNLWRTIFIYKYQYNYINITISI